MAATAASKPLASLNFSSDHPSRLALTPAQFKRCSEALDCLKKKLRMPYQLNQEFSHLETSRIMPSETKRNGIIALDGVNLSNILMSCHCIEHQLMELELRLNLGRTMDHLQRGTLMQASLQ
ncbi:hypothetical protein PanWU01x14_166460 [Parasponia andersonii]|uniref:Uncharacterized protein n=1 Tax=Parasponia andersonii TaxID=3476 RepID=A0A2P5CBR8_PARAD|nr:hypothetical protein PanWU01x14_166460 [Parasponia andersonii]